MTLSVSPNQTGINTALRSFLLTCVSEDVEIIVGQANRNPEPHVPDFIIFTPIRRRRISTNVDFYQDSFFTGSILGTAMTAGDVTGLPLAPGRQIFGVGIALGTVVVSGPPEGGPGAYQISPSQNVATGTISAGAATFTQATEIVYQVDCHSDDVTDSADMAQIITTMFRDQYAVDFFNALPYDVWPLEADDPKQAPFNNAEDQNETRWILEMKLQANQVVSGVPVQFASIVNVKLIDVDTLINNPTFLNSLDFSDPRNSMYIPGF